MLLATGYIYIGLEKYWLLVRNIIEALKSIPGGVTVLLYETFQVTPDWRKDLDNHTCYISQLYLLHLATLLATSHNFTGYISQFYWLHLTTLPATSHNFTGHISQPYRLHLTTLPATSHNFTGYISQLYRQHLTTLPANRQENYNLLVTTLRL